MQIKTTTSHDVIFSVEAFLETEGGMNHETYGKPVAELPAAIHLLELARAADPKTDWIIVLDVATKVSS